MPRKLKKFEEIPHGPFMAVICLDADGEFSCNYGGETYASTSLVMVRAWASKRLRDMSDLKWDPIMRVNFDREDDRVNNLANCMNLQLYIERIYIAWCGKWVQTPWVVMPPGTTLCCGPNVSDMEQGQHSMSDRELMQQRIARSIPFHAATGQGNVLRFPLIYRDGLGQDSYFVPYTADRWVTMIGIIDKVRDLRARLHEMLSNVEGWNQLAAIAGTRLLDKAELSNDNTRRVAGTAELT